MIEGLAPPPLALAAVIVFAAFVVRGMSGFGAGILGYGAAGYYSRETLFLCARLLLMVAGASLLLK